MSAVPLLASQESGHSSRPSSHLRTDNRGSCKFLPVVDGDLLRSLPSAALKAGAFAKVPYLGGHTTDDGSIFVGEASKITTDAQVVAAITSRYKYLVRRSRPTSSVN